MLINRLRYVVQLREPVDEPDVLILSEVRNSDYSNYLRHVLRVGASGELESSEAARLLERLNRMPAVTGIHLAIDRERRAWRKFAAEHVWTKEQQLHVESAPRYFGWIHAAAAVPPAERPVELAFAAGLIDEAVRDEAIYELSRSAFNLEDQVPVLYDLARISLGLLVFKDDEGRWPDSIEELVPRQLPVLPLDRSSGSTYRYRVQDETKAIIYSIGSAGVDHGGEGAPWTWGAIFHDRRLIANLIVHVRSAPEN